MRNGFKSGVAGLIACVALAACGQSPSSAVQPTAALVQQTAAAPATVVPTAPAPETPVELSFWTTPNNPEGGSPPADWAVYTTLREKQNIDLKLTLLPLGADGETKMNAAAASNELPDLLGMTRNQYYQYLELGLLAPVDDLLPLMPERTKRRYSDPSRTKLVSADGRVYAFQEPPLPPNPKRSGLAIRQDWLDKLGLKAPTTLEEFLAVAKAFTEQDPDGNGKNDTYGFGAYLSAGAANPTLGAQFDFIYGAYGLAGAWDFRSPTAFGANVKNPDYQQATAFVKQLVDAKVIDPDWPTMKVDDFRSRWKQGRYGMFFEDFCAMICKTNYQDFDTNNPSGQLVFIDPPKGPKGDSAAGTFVSVGGVLGVSKRAIESGKGPAIARFLEWADSKEGYYLIGFGQEGINYKIDPSGMIVTAGVPAPHDVKEQQPILQIKGLVYNGSDQELSARYPAFQTSDGRTIAPLEYVKMSTQMPWLDATPAALIKPAATQADIDRYIQEALIQFILGNQPLDDATWGAFVQGLDGVGFAAWEAAAKQTLQEAGFVE